MVTQREAKQGPTFQTFIIIMDNKSEATIQRFFTQADNDHYAEGMKLMGAKGIYKSWFNKTTQQWVEYTTSIVKPL